MAIQLHHKLVGECLFALLFKLCDLGLNLNNFKSEFRIQFKN